MQNMCNYHEPDKKSSMPPNALTKDEVEALEYFVKQPAHGHLTKPDDWYDKRTTAHSALAKLRQPSKLVGWITEDGIRALESAKEHSQDPHRIQQGIAAGSDDAHTVPLYTHPAPRPAFDEAKERMAYEKWAEKYFVIHPCYTFIDVWLAAKQEGGT